MANCISKMMRYCSPVGAWLILALGSGSTAQALDPNHKLTQYVHRTWQTQAGLSQASIYVVTQTRDGYLWVGTQSGVARFDGVEFQPIRALQANSLGDVWARAMVEDAAGRVWITTNDFHLIRVTGSSVKVLGAYANASTRHVMDTASMSFSRHSAYSKLYAGVLPCSPPAA